MFLTRRATQAEYLDSPDLPDAEVHEAYAALARVNRIFFFAEPFQRLLPKFLGLEHCASLSFLDLGAGDGSLGATLSDWARKRGWEWRFTHLDVNIPGLRLARSGRSVAASALSLPFHDATFDVVIASQMTHHLTTDEDIRRHLSEAWRVARRAVFMTDLHRGILLYSVVWLLLHLRPYPDSFRRDGLLSIQRGFRVHELAALARAAGMSGAEVALYYRARLILQACKTSLPDSTRS